MEETVTAPDSGETTEQRDDLAPRFRRILAWIVDLMLTVAVSQLLFGVIAYFVPPDTASTMWPPLMAGLLVGLAYFGFATPVFGNMLGKGMFGIKIVGHEGQHTTVLRWFVRLLLVCLWPINGFMLLFSRSRRHLGDLASKTYVAFVEPERNFWLGFVGLIVVVFVAIQVGKFGMMIGILNAPSYNTAKMYLSENNNGQEVSTFPEGFQIVNDQALFDFEVGDKYHRVLLQRVGSTWEVKDSEHVDEPSTGVNISFGSVSSSSDP